MLVVVLCLLVPRVAPADATDRLLTVEAERALARNDASLAVAWVAPGAEGEARRAFDTARGVFATGGAAREVAVGYLASVLGRLREEPSPAAATPPDPPRVELALTRALQRRSSSPVRQLLDELMRQKLDRALADVRLLADYRTDDLAGARLYVRSYAAVAGYVARVAAAAASPISDRVANGPELHEQTCACDCPECTGAECPPCACVCVGGDPHCPQPGEVTWIVR